MSFLGDMINKLTHQNQESSQGQQGGYNAGQQRQQFQPQQPGFPQVQPPWIARWDNNRGTWFYFNEQTGEQSLQHPSTRGYAGTQGYGGNNQTYQGVQQQQQQQPYQGEPRKHGYGGIAMGAAAGVVGGAALMYGAHEIHENYDEDKTRVEGDINRAESWGGREFENGVQSVQDFPQDAARWTGRKVGEVENIPQNIENRFDNAVDDVQDIPDDVAGWTGRRVGDAERVGDGVEGDFDDARQDVDRFGDGVDSAYDQGRADGRDDDDGY